MKKSQGRILIIGGTGFIGKHLVKAALKRNYDVSVISLNLPESSTIEKSAKYFEVDISNIKNLSSVMPHNQFDYVINLGGYVDHSDYLDGGKRIIQTHFNGTVNLVNFLDWKSLKAFIQAGSSDEYGDCIAPQKEDMREKPFSTYSFSKLSASHFLQMLGKAEEFPSVILRLFLVYGPDQATNRFIPQIIKGCLNNERFDVSPGNQLRDFCHIDDIVNGIFCALEGKRLFGEIINLASGNPVKIKDVIIMIQQLIGSGEPNFGKLPYRQNENMQLYADISKAKRLLGWSPSIKLEHGIKRLIDECRSKS